MVQLMHFFSLKIWKICHRNVRKAIDRWRDAVIGTPATARTQKQQGDEQQPTTAKTTATTDTQATEMSHQH
jgi:hypothetical protein